MAEIEIVYRRGRCEFGEPEYHIQCHTCWGDEMGCALYHADGAGDTDKNGNKIIPFGDCESAKFEYGYKGWVGKKYEIGEPNEDVYNPHLNSVEVTLGNTTYDAVKVRFNGKLIFNNYDDEEDTENGE